MNDDYNLYWYHYGDRYYDPQLRRWMQVDPADEFHSPYVYVGNMPTIATDPDGKIANLAIPLAVYFLIDYLMSATDLGISQDEQLEHVLNLEDIEVPEDTQNIILTVAKQTAETTGKVEKLMNITVVMGFEKPIAGAYNTTINMTANGVKAISYFSDGKTKEGTYNLTKFLASPIGHFVSQKFGGRIGALTNIAINSSVEYVGSGHAKQDIDNFNENIKNGWDMMWIEFFRMYKP